jgi:RNA polymerase-binding transcription factor DksA
MSLRIDDAPTRARLRKALLRKGSAIATELADLLAGKGKKFDLQSLPAQARKPGMRPEERLRAFLDHVESCRKRLDADDDSYGRCQKCGVELGLPALEQMPWADRCQTCAPLP